MRPLFKGILPRLQLKPSVLAYIHDQLTRIKYTRFERIILLRKMYDICVYIYVGCIYYIYIYMYDAYNAIFDVSFIIPCFIGVCFFEPCC